METPFKVYIYCIRPYTGSTDDNFYIYPNDKPRKVNGYVIGEFICDDIDTVHVFNDILYCVKNSQENKLGQMCMTIEEVKAYLGEKDGYNWHISDLKIYDVPKTLSEFKHPCPYTDGTHCIQQKCEFYGDWSGVCRNWMERPPQSWCYVEEN